MQVILWAEKRMYYVLSTLFTSWERGYTTTGAMWRVILWRYNAKKGLWCQLSLTSPAQSWGTNPTGARWGAIRAAWLWEDTLLYGPDRGCEGSRKHREGPSGISPHTQPGPIVKGQLLQPRAAEDYITQQALHGSTAHHPAPLGAKHLGSCSPSPSGSLNRKSFLTLSGYLARSFPGFHGYPRAANGARACKRGGRGEASGGPTRGGLVAGWAGSGHGQSPWGRPLGRGLVAAGRRWAAAAAPGGSPSRRMRTRTSRWWRACGWERGSPGTGVLWGDIATRPGSARPGPALLSSLLLGGRSPPPSPPRPVNEGFCCLGRSGERLCFPSG